MSYHLSPSKFNSEKNLRSKFLNYDYAAKNTYTLTSEEFYLSECSREKRHRKKTGSSFPSRDRGSCHSKDNNESIQQLNDIKSLSPCNHFKLGKRKSQSPLRVMFTDTQSNRPLEKVIDIQSYKKFNASNTFNKANKQRSHMSACCFIW